MGPKTDAVRLQQEREQAKRVELQKKREAAIHERQGKVALDNYKRIFAEKEAMAVLKRKEEKTETDVVTNSGPEERVIAMPPGYYMFGFVKFLVSQRSIDEVYTQLIGDYREEYYLALAKNNGSRAGIKPKLLLIHTRHKWAFLCAFLVSVISPLISMLKKAQMKKEEEKEIPEASEEE